MRRFYDLSTRWHELGNLPFVVQFLLSSSLNVQVVPFKQRVSVLHAHLEQDKVQYFTSTATSAIHAQMGFGTGTLNFIAVLYELWIVIFHAALN